jgi:flagellar hook assembly protein FlgD
VLSLGRPYPNPARGSVTLAWSLPVAQSIQLIVYDISGRVVATLAHGRFSAGNHVSIWDGQSDTGHATAPGVYLLRLVDPERSLVRKMVKLH